MARELMPWVEENLSDRYGPWPDGCSLHGILSGIFDTTFDTDTGELTVDGGWFYGLWGEDVLLTKVMESLGQPAYACWHNDDDNAEWIDVYDGQKLRGRAFLAGEAMVEWAKGKGWLESRSAALEGPNNLIRWEDGLPQGFATLADADGNAMFLDEDLLHEGKVEDLPVEARHAFDRVKVLAPCQGTDTYLFRAGRDNYGVLSEIELDICPSSDSHCQDDLDRIFDDLAVEFAVSNPDALVLLGTDDLRGCDRREDGDYARTFGVFTPWDMNLGRFVQVVEGHRNCVGRLWRDIEELYDMHKKQEAVQSVGHGI